MAVAYVDAVALRAYFDSRIINGIAVDAAQQLQNLSFDLLFLAIDERNDIVRGIQ